MVLRVKLVSLKGEFSHENETLSFVFRWKPLKNHDQDFLNFWKSSFRCWDIWVWSFRLMTSSFHQKKCWHTNFLNTKVWLYFEGYWPNKLKVWVKQIWKMLLKIAYDVTQPRPGRFKFLLTWRYLKFGNKWSAGNFIFGMASPISEKCIKFSIRRQAVVELLLCQQKFDTPRAGLCDVIFYF